MKLTIDISKDRYDEIMTMDWVNCRRFFDEELRAIHDGKVLEPCGDCISRQAAIDAIWDGTNMDIYTREVKECLESLPPVTPYEKAINDYIKELNTMGPYEKAINDISDIMSAIDLPDRKDLIPEFRTQTIAELEENFTFMIEMLYHINEVLDNIGGI